MNIIDTAIRKIIARFVFLFSKKSTVTFKGCSKSPLVLPTHTVIGYLDDIQVCSFEHLVWNERSMTVGHFGVMEQYRGMDLGTRCLTDFAVLISEQVPLIEEIQFHISRSSSGTDIELLANARVRLLEKIGATDIDINNPTSDCYVVTGVWRKSKWKYTL